MSTVQAERASDSYALERTSREYDRLRAQSLMWEPATRRLLDQIALAPGARCLDAGCGPGETMRLMAELVGPIGARARGRRRRNGGQRGVDDAASTPGIAGASSCTWTSAATSFPEAPTTSSTPDCCSTTCRSASPTLRRLWDAVAPGGHLLVQDYDLRAVSVLPALASVDELARVVVAAFTAAGCDVHVGARLPELFARAAIGPPDGTDVAGRLDTFGDAHTMLTGVYRSLMPTAIASGITTDERAAALLAEIARDAARFPDRAMLWPLLVGAWKRKPVAGERSG